MKVTAEAAEDILRQVGVDPQFYASLDNFSQAEKFFDNAVKGVHRALHPDQGGSTEAYQQFQQQLDGIKLFKPGALWWSLQDHNKQRNVYQAEEVPQTEVSRFVLGEFQRNLADEVAQSTMLVRGPGIRSFQSEDVKRADWLNQALGYQASKQLTVTVTGFEKRVENATQRVQYLDEKIATFNGFMDLVGQIRDADTYGELNSALEEIDEYLQASIQDSNRPFEYHKQLRKATNGIKTDLPFYTKRILSEELEEHKDQTIPEGARRYLAASTARIVLNTSTSRSDRENKQKTIESLQKKLYLLAQHDPFDVLTRKKIFSTFAQELPEALAPLWGKISEDAISLPQPKLVYVDEDMRIREYAVTPQDAEMPSIDCYSSTPLTLLGFTSAKGIADVIEKRQRTQVRLGTNKSASESKGITLDVLAEAQIQNTIVSSPDLSLDLLAHNQDTGRYELHGRYVETLP